MDVISELIEQLKGELLSVRNLEQGYNLKQEIVQCSLSIPLSYEPDLFAWLDSQLTFPQFYWCSRELEQDVVACGAAVQFTSIDEADQFIRRYPESSLRVWGANAFDQRTPNAVRQDAKGFFFLPRLEISTQSSELTVLVNLYSETSLEDDAKCALVELERLLPLQEKAKQYVEIVSTHHMPEQEQWSQLIQQSLSAIEQQQFDKVVMARKTTLSLKAPLNPVQFIQKSKHINTHCYHFMLRFNAGEAFLGSSPERLYLRQAQHLYTEALAGTVANDLDDNKARELANWLMNDEKNQYENGLVVNDILQRLEPVTTNIAIQPCEVVRLRKVQHLRHKIDADLQNSDDKSIIHWLQPTAAVSGLPRQPAFQFILDNEPFDRQWYAGSIGYLSFHQSEFSVSLRSALIEGHNIHIYAGAGIVKGSEPLHEWIEINNKASGLITLIKED